LGSSEIVAESATLVPGKAGVYEVQVTIPGSVAGGDAVNVAARLEALAEPGGVYVSAIVRQSVGSRLELDFEDLLVASPSLQFV
jgi:adenylate cyclase